MIEITIKELYNNIWKYPLSELSKRWNVNPTKLGNLCDSEGIPRPKSGYWTQLATNKNVLVLTLPKEIDSSKLINLTSILIKKGKDASSAQLKLKPKITVPKTLRKPHRLTVIAKQQYHKPTFKYDKLMIGAWKGETFQFAVSPEQFNRALRIFDTLIKYFEKKNWEFKITDNFTRRGKINAVIIDGKTVTFKLREKTKQTPRVLNEKEKEDKLAGRYVYHEKVLMPTGIFHLTIEEYVENNCKTAFIEKLEEPIENKLDEFVASLITTSEFKKRQDIKRAIEEQERIKKQELEDFLKMEVQKEKDNIAFLFDQFENWQKAEKAKQFVAAIKARIHTTGEITKNQAKWLRWAEYILLIDDPVAKAIDFSNKPKIENDSTRRIEALAIKAYFKEHIR